MTGKLLFPRWVDSMPTDSDDSRSSPSQSLAGSSEADTGDLSGLSDLLEAVGFPRQESGEDPLLGVSFDGVTLLRMIAQGGMGRVYEAEQEKPRRRVAVKVVRPGLTSPTLLKRFAYEAEILGRLTHPGIAQIHAVGVHVFGDTPLPYFIMEYVAGAKTLVRYADDNGLSTRQRLGLFADVCAAVAHGHQRGVIHRDLKPSNILVDDTGQVKVIDFGVARATDSDITLTTMHSDVGQLIGTLQYMSPEQFDANPHDIDIRCDVYALGVVLYELLTGRLPYNVRQKAVLEVMRIVKEDEPVSLLSHQPTLRRDVAVIAEKCLRKEPAGRYASASELAADIGRHLRGESILAAPSGFWEGLMRLARRHKAAAVAVAGILTCVAVALVAISLFAIRTERAMRLAQTAQAAEAEQRTAAEAARSRAEAGEADARRRLYASRAVEASRSLNNYRRDLAEEFWKDAKEAFREAYGDAPVPPELPLIAASLDDSVGLFSGHTGSIFAVAVSRACGRVVTAARDRTIRVWDAATCQCITTFETTAAVRQLAVHPTATLLAGITVAGGLVLIDWETGESFALERPENEVVASVAFSPDGNQLAVGTDGGVISLWDATSKGQQGRLSGHRGRVSSLRFSPDSTLLASGSGDKTARVWNIALQSQVNELETGAPISDLAFSIDGRRLLVGSHDWHAQAWDFVNEDRLALQTGSAVQQVAFTAAGRRVVTLSRGGVVKLWDADSGADLQLLGGPLVHANRVAVSPDGGTIAVGCHDGSLRLFNAETGDHIATQSGSHGGVTEVTFLTDDQVLTAGFAWAARSWQFTRAGEPGRLAYLQRAPFKACCFIPGTSWLATGSTSHSVGLWDSQTGMLIGQLPDFVTCRTLAASPDGSRLAAGGRRNDACVWDLFAGVVHANFRGHNNEVSSVAFSPDGRYLATGSFDASVRLWSLDSGRAVARFETGGLRVVSVAFHPAGKQLAVGMHQRRPGQKTVQVWNIPAGTLATELDESLPTHAVAFNSRGDQLAAVTTGGLITIFDFRTGDRIHRLAGHTGVVGSLVFTADGTRLLSGSEDGSARLWDTGTGDVVAEFRRHQGGITAASLTADTRQLATASDDDTVRLWGLTAREIVRKRNAAPAIRRRMQPLAEEIQAAEPASRRTQLMAARETLPEDDWRELSNLVLIGAIEELKAATAAEPEVND